MATTIADIALVSSRDEYYDLGSFHRPVSTASSSAQAWFNRGLTWCYAFNHEEATKCFEQAIRKDSNCALAYWGLAYSLGPNYNKPWEFFDSEDLTTTVIRAHGAAVNAKLKASRASPVEQALITSIQCRYPDELPSSDCSSWNKEYTVAMEMVYQQFPTDLDVATLYAESLMNLTPWAMWDLDNGKPAEGARTVQAKEVLEVALSQEGGRRHPGLLHMYIHLMEMSNQPETAISAANCLRGLIPDAGHLNHMPTHLDMLVGDYENAIIWNSAAIVADEKFLAKAGPLNFYTLYRSHDYHFRIYAAMFAGQLKPAMESVAALEASIPEDLLRVKSPPMSDWLETFLTTRVHVLIRFGRWQDILDLKQPRDRALFCVNEAMLHYGRGVALAATGHIREADREREMFKIAHGQVPESRTLFNNRSVDILAVAGAMLDGEIEYRRGDFATAFDHLRRSISLYDSLPYDEPWGWMQPPRHAYGALMLEQGHAEEAAAVYRADLGKDKTLARAHQHPNNVWALHGYHECLVELGHTEEAATVERELKVAMEKADVPIVASCHCRGITRN